MEAFLAGGGSICPFAAKSRRIYVTVSSEPRNDRVALRRAAEEFATTRDKTPPAALIILGTQEGFEPTKLWAREVFLELLRAFGLVELVFPIRLLEKIIAEQVRPILFDDEDPRRPALHCRGQRLFTICMAPCYPRTHPRYAPQSSVVVTWLSDVAAVAQPSVRTSIQAAMEREHGFVYDADDLMLPLPERKT